MYILFDKELVNRHDSVGVDIGSLKSSLWVSVHPRCTERDGFDKIIGSINDVQNGMALIAWTIKVWVYFIQNAKVLALFL